VAAGAHEAGQGVLDGLSTDRTRRAPSIIRASRDGAVPADTALSGFAANPARRNRDVNRIARTPIPMQMALDWAMACLLPFRPVPSRQPRGSARNLSAPPAAGRFSPTRDA